MTMIKKLFRSSLILLSQRIGIQAIAAIAQLVIIPFLTPGEFGEFLLLVSVGNLLSPFLHWGISISITKHASGALGNSSLTALHLGQHGGLLVRLGVLFLVVMGGFAGAIHVLWGAQGLGFQLPYHLVILLVVSMAMASASELVVSQTLLALDKVMMAAFLGGGPRNILFLCLIFVAILVQKPDLQLMSLLQIIAGLFGFVICVGAYLHVWLAAKQASQISDELPGPSQDITSRSILALGASAMGSYLLAQARHSMEPILIRLFFGVELTGLVGLARRIANIINMAAQSFGAILGPYAARHDQPDERPMLNNLHGAVSLVTAALCLVGVAGLLVFGSAPLVGMFGQSYELAHPYLLIMLVLLLIRCLVGFPVYALLVRGGQNDVLLSYIFDLAASVAVFLFAWHMGNITVAIIGIGVVQIIQYAWLWRQAQRILHLRVDAFVLLSALSTRLKAGASGG